MNGTSRRTFLRGSAAAMVAGGTMLSARTPEFISVAQTSASPEAGGSFEPASTNVPQAEYPRIDAQTRRVQFRIRAPDTRRVEIVVGGGGGETPRMDLVKQADGNWTLTTPTLVEGFRNYTVYMDGFAATDPGSYTYYDSGRNLSGIEIPSSLASDSFYQIRDVPHGAVREQWCHSSVTGTWRRFFVYMPPGYDNEQHVRYPVLYLLHGSGGNETQWPGQQGLANFIMDNLIASGAAKPMIVVMPDDYARLAGAPEPDLSQTSAPAAGMQSLTAGFEDDLTQVVIPFADKNYRTLTDRDHRAIAGLSMGGILTFRVALNHPELFSYIGGFSGANVATDKFDPKTSFNGAFADPAAFAKRWHLLWLGLGTHEAERITRGVSAFNDDLNEAGIKHVFYQSPGTAHEWQTWRRDLNEFAPRLFRA